MALTCLLPFTWENDTCILPGTFPQLGGVVDHHEVSCRCLWPNHFNLVIPLFVWQKYGANISSPPQSQIAWGRQQGDTMTSSVTPGSIRRSCSLQQLENMTYEKTHVAYYHHKACVRGKSIKRVWNINRCNKQWKHVKNPSLPPPSTPNSPRYTTLCYSHDIQ